MRSLRSRLFLVWILSLAAAVAVGALLVQFYRQSSMAQSDQAEVTLGQTCDAMVDRYGYYSAGWAGLPAALGSVEATASEAAFKHDMAALATLVLIGRPGLIAGVWQRDSGLIATGGAGAAALSQAQSGLLRDVVGGAVQDDRPVTVRMPAGTGTLLLTACPLRGPVPGLGAFVMATVETAPGYDRLRLGVAVLLALVLGTSVALTWLIVAWTRHVGRIEAALARHAAGALPRLPPTGERELDRIIAALNTAGERLDDARAHSDALAARVAVAERMAALGRVAAGVAHEIRNPIAAMRLKAEGGLAGDDARRRAALTTVLEQIARLDRLIAELLAMTQRRAPDFATVDMRDLLAACAAEHRDAAAAAGVVLGVTTAGAVPVRCDAAMLRRTLDNLAQNALRHTPPGGRVELRASVTPAGVRIAVADTGPGVAESVHASLFEPFVTGRADGTGLGLAIARELVEAQGGQLTLAETAAGKGAVFVIDMPAG